MATVRTRRPQRVSPREGWRCPRVQPCPPPPLRGSALEGLPMPTPGLGLPKPPPASSLASLSPFGTLNKLDLLSEVLFSGNVLCFWN